MKGRRNTTSAAVILFSFSYRPHDVLKELTPNEVLKGELPANVCFANQIVKARMVRLKENKSSKCCNYSF
jgi:hypothetical protein